MSSITKKQSLYLKIKEKREKIKLIITLIMKIIHQIINFNFPYFQLNHY